jgi:hypothetical protein
VTAALGGLGLALLTGCSGISLDDRAGLSCIDDTPYCVAQREKTLKSMLADKDHKWVREAPTAQAHATGVRLFAFRSKKAELSCHELVHGRKEAEVAPRVLKGHQGLTPAQVSRAALFAAEVQKELAAEIRRRRCRT